MSHARTVLVLLALLFQVASVGQGHAAKPVALQYSRAELETKWRARVQSFLDKGVIPLIDLQSSLKRKDGARHLEDGMAAMDALGVALIVFDGYQASKDEGGGGYRWSYYIHQVVNAHPDRFVLATNGGTNKNWLKGKSSYISQVEEHVRGGDYPIMGELDFRHYMSNSQCRKGRTDRDSDIPLDGAHGQRLLRLSAETGVPLVIHLEPEDAPLEALERMLKAHPKATVVVAHFGQLRYPERQRKFGPALVRRLLGAYPNLYYDISTGQPGRRYKCNDKVLDTVIWQDDGGESQDPVLKDEYRAILNEFSRHFVAGTDYGGGRAPLPDYLDGKVGNIRLILSHLPTAAKHDIAYRNAWRLLTGRDWK